MKTFLLLSNLNWHTNTAFQIGYTWYIVLLVSCVFSDGGSITARYFILKLAMHPSVSTMSTRDIVARLMPPPSQSSAAYAYNHCADAYVPCGRTTARWKESCHAHAQGTELYERKHTLVPSVSYSSTVSSFLSRKPTALTHNAASIGDAVIGFWEEKRFPVTVLSCGHGD